jgi:8-oxo-dGTP diphosphatase
MQQKYVCGMLISTDTKFVTMLTKNRPEYLAGKLNFPGGKIEDNETPLEAVTREFEEETGVRIEDWTLVGTFGDDSFIIYYYAHRSFKVFDVRTQTDEEVMNQFTREILYPSDYTPVNQPDSLMLALALQEQIQYPVHFPYKSN